jgi:ribosomal protein S18 acetylase RimI-like enzyme
MNIRPYRQADERAVIALWQACELTRPWNDPLKDIERKLTTQADWFLVGSDGDALVASAMFGYDGHRGGVNYLAVAPAFRGRGHARALMAAGESLMLQAGCPKLNLQIRTSNLGALDFYRHLGYGEDDVISLGKRLIPDN